MEESVLGFLRYGDGQEITIKAFPGAIEGTAVLNILGPSSHYFEFDMPKKQQGTDQLKANVEKAAFKYARRVELPHLFDGLQMKKKTDSVGFGYRSDIEAYLR